MSILHFERVDLDGGARLGTMCWKVPRSERIRKNIGTVLLVGEAPSRGEARRATSRPGEPLTHRGRCGKRIMLMCGLSAKQYYLLYDRANLLPPQAPSDFLGEKAGDTFDYAAARRAAAGLVRTAIARRYHLVVLLGRRVQRAFGLELNEESVYRSSFFAPVEAAGLKLVAVPHPSGTSRWWNDQNNRLCAERFWRWVTQEAVRA